MVRSKQTAKKSLPAAATGKVLRPKVNLHAKRTRSSTNAASTSAASTSAASTSRGVTVRIEEQSKVKQRRKRAYRQGMLLLFYYLITFYCFFGVSAPEKDFYYCISFLSKHQS
jgi:hypothetical protein